MIKQEDIVFRHKVGGYTYIYDNVGFIHAYDTDNVSEPGAQSITSVKCLCKTKKDFELEILYIHSSDKFKNLSLEDE